MAKSSVGAVAQLGERLLCKQEVTGSIPVSSTRSKRNFCSEHKVTAQCWASTRHRHYLFYGFPQRRFGADHWTGQASSSRSTPSYVERWLQGETRKGETGSLRSAHSRSGGAGLEISRRTIFDN